MANKFYAVKQGKKAGIYTTWGECKAQVDGFSGAIYKSFPTKSEAEAFIFENFNNSTEAKYTEPVKDKDIAVAYVDGSYNNATQEFSYGMVIFYQGEELHFSQKVESIDLASMRNVAGEIKGAEAAMRFAIEHGCAKIKIYHDYEGIARWCLGEWKTNKEGTKAYKAFYDTIKDKVQVEFVKVKGHSNDKYNDIADSLAKQAIF